VFNPGYVNSKGAIEVWHPYNFDAALDGALVLDVTEIEAARRVIAAEATPFQILVNNCTGTTCKPRLRRFAVDVLTPPAILQVLSAGYEPHWHPSTNDLASSSRNKRLHRSISSSGDFEGFQTVLLPAEIATPRFVKLHFLGIRR
jgi:hypothetical protein